MEAQRIAVHAVVELYLSGVGIPSA